MKTNQIFIFWLLVSFTLQAQLKVIDNNYIYVNDNFMYVTDDVYLKDNSNIYLRKDSQLLQGTTAIGTNKGAGSLSVYQEGTVNNFQYNYWCSPVSGRNSNSPNQAFSINQLGVPSIASNPTSFNPATILASDNYNGVSTNSSLSIAPYWIWKFIARNTYDFNGASNTYTPATFNTYDGSGTQLGSVRTGQNYQRRFSPVGQGFMVRSTSTVGNTSGNFVIRNSYRTFIKEGDTNNSEFQRTSNAANNNGFYNDIPNVEGINYSAISNEPTPHIKINTLLNNQAVRQIAMIFMNNALDGYDPADTESADIGNLPYDMYFYLVNSEFIHDARKFDINNKYAIGFKCNSDAVFRMRAVEIVNFNETQDVYLHDKLTDEYFNIRNSDVTINLPAGVNNTRYELTLTNNTLETHNNFKNNFDIYQNNSDTMLTVKNPDLVSITNVKLFDIQGKVIFDKKDLEVNSLYQFNTNSLSQGIYIVKMITKTNQEITKKLSITNIK